MFPSLLDHFRSTLVHLQVGTITSLNLSAFPKLSTFGIELDDKRPTFNIKSFILKIGPNLKRIVATVRTEETSIVADPKIFQNVQILKKVKKEYEVNLNFLKSFLYK